MQASGANTSVAPVFFAAELVYMLESGILKAYSILIFFFIIWVQLFSSVRIWASLFLHIRLEQDCLMDLYYGSGINDYLVPKDQDLLDRHSSPDSWSNWGISAPEGFNLPRMFTNLTEVEFNVNDESCNNKIELEYSFHDKYQPTNSSLGGALPEQSFHQAAFSCDQLNFQLQELSRFAEMDDIFSDFVHEDHLCVENVNKSFHFYPDVECHITPGGLQKDIAASKFVTCFSESNACLDIEMAPPVTVLDPSEQTNGDEGICEEILVEEFILEDLLLVIAQFTEKSRICFRDALYRLARDTKQEHVDQNGSHKMQKAMPHTDGIISTRPVNKKSMESRTASVDRAVANLMFNKMETYVLDLLPLTANVSSIRKK